jgi:hypothetical protein
MTEGCHTKEQNLLLEAENSRPRTQHRPQPGVAEASIEHQAAADRVLPSFVLRPLSVRVP